MPCRNDGIRLAIRADLERRRTLNIEARRCRFLLDQVDVDRKTLSMANIAQRHGVRLTVVQAIASAMPWTEDELAAGMLPAIRQSETAQRGVRSLRT